MMMFVRVLRGVLVVACTLVAGTALADIYTWTDAAGMVNVSNVAPPEGVKITKITQDSPPRPAPMIDAAAEAARQAEVQALAARVRQLEYEAQAPMRQMPAPVDYAAVAPPFPMQPSFPMQYAVEAPPQTAAYDCDPTWTQCGPGPWWGAPFFPATVIVVRAPGFRRPPPFHGGHKPPMQMPVRAPGMRRG
jgi:hypothetical protein